jgi:hypothetical protein
MQSQLRINIECSFGMLVNRWGILWKPIRCETNKVPLLIAVCMKLHNFILDHGSAVVPEAIVLDSPPNGKKSPLDARVRLSAPDIKHQLNVLPGNDNLSRTVAAGATREFLCAQLASTGHVRPAHSSAQQRQRRQDQFD